MKSAVLFCVFLVLTMAGHAAASTVDENKAYPEFQAGVTGVWVSIEPGHVMTVSRVEPARRVRG